MCLVNIVGQTGFHLGQVLLSPMSPNFPQVFKQNTDNLASKMN